MATETETLRLLLDASAEGLRRELRSADAATEKFQRNASQHFAKVDTAMSRLDGVVGKLGKGLIGLGAGLSVVGLAAFVRKTTEAADTLATTADRIGITAERFQELSYAAKRTDADFNALPKSLERYGKRLGEAQAGTGELLKITNGLGIAVRDADGRARGFDAVLSDLADAIAETSNHQERLRIATGAFGREGAGMVLLLKNGSQGLASLSKEARDAGVVLGEQLVREGALLNDEFDKMGERMDATTARLTLGLVPALRTATDWFNRAGTAAGNFLVEQFGDDKAQSLETLERRATNLRTVLDALTKAGAANGSAYKATALRLGEIQTAIDAIMNPVAPTAGPAAPLGDLPALTVATTDNLVDLQAELDAARRAFDALASGGTDAYAAIMKTLEVEERAAKSADAYNRANKALIESGQIKARTGAEYIAVLRETAEVQDATQDAEKLDQYIAKLTQEYGIAKLRLEAGEDEVKVQTELNKLRDAGVTISEDTEQVIRRTIAATAALNDQWDANQQAIKDSAKALEDAQAQVTDARDFPDHLAAEFAALIQEALL
ncbi:MAG: hypothetical protein GC206_17105 [Alphaproteobacteria bacterium]|nr:hypothetical protein [Alphaproteobacteria bacterium]